MKALAGDQRYKYTRKYYDYLDGNLDALAGAQAIHAKIAKLFEKQGSQPPNLRPSRPRTTNRRAGSETASGGAPSARIDSPRPPMNSPKR